MKVRSPMETSGCDYFWGGGKKYCLFQKFNLYLWRDKI